MNSKNFRDGADIPLGLTMAMAQNPQAFDSFSKLSLQQKQEVISCSRQVRSRKEMQELTDNLAHGQMPHLPNSFR